MIFQRNNFQAYLSFSFWYRIAFIFSRFRTLGIMSINSRRLAVFFFSLLYEYFVVRVYEFIYNKPTGCFLMEVGSLWKVRAVFFATGELVFEYFMWGLWHNRDGVLKKLSLEDLRWIRMIFLKSSFNGLKKGRKGIMGGR